ncbi:MAG TPA: hypothetical protein VFI75_03710 [Candidatus Acidoferrum sp.]|jgi:hypothetical protein|nr:hypothetical protein [Candidatus Acidoferrum sp.]
MNADNRLDALLTDFIAAWEKLDGLCVDSNLDDIAGQFTVTNDIPNQVSYWRPLPQITDASALDPLYAELPARFPPLFEKLLLSYRWPEVDLRLYRIHGNPIGTDLSGFLGRITKDHFLFNFAVKNGYIPFGKGGDMDYDPVCFDLRSRKKNREFEIVKLDHEEILCNERIRVAANLAPSFEQLVKQSIDAASKI